MSTELDATEEKLIIATFGIIQREGFKGATTKKIAAEAGVNEVTVFRKFKNKNNLIEATKNYYLQRLVDKLNEAFSFSEDEEIEEYLQNKFLSFINLPEEDFAIIKVALEEFGEISEKRHLISLINETIIENIEAYFKLQIEKGTIREVDSRVLAVICYGVAFQSMVLLRVNAPVSEEDKNKFGKNYIDILFNGIKN